MPVYPGAFRNFGLNIRNREPLVAIDHVEESTPSIGFETRPASETRFGIGQVTKRVHTHGTARWTTRHLPRRVAGRRRCPAATAGTTSQPALSAIVTATAHADYDTGLNLAAVCDLEPYWKALRKVYAPFESGLPTPRCLHLLKWRCPEQ